MTPKLVLWKTVKVLIKFNNFFKIFFQEHCQSVEQFGSRTANVLSVLIWVQTVCKGNQQKTKVVAGKERATYILVKNYNSHNSPVWMCRQIHTGLLWAFIVHNWLKWYFSGLVTHMQMNYGACLLCMQLGKTLTSLLQILLGKSMR